MCCHSSQKGTREEKLASRHLKAHKRDKKGKEAEKIRSRDNQEARKSKVNGGKAATLTCVFSSLPYFWQQALKTLTFISAQHIPRVRRELWISSRLPYATPLLHLSQHINLFTCLSPQASPNTDILKDKDLCINFCILSALQNT